MKLRRIALQASPEFGRALRYEAEIEATESKRRTPVDTSALRNSVHAEGPIIEGGLIGQRLSASVVAGGPAASYAIYVHEDLEAHHKIGQAKFIESTLNESAPFLAARIANRIDLNKIVR